MSSEKGIWERYKLNKERRNYTRYKYDDLFLLTLTIIIVIMMTYLLSEVLQNIFTGYSVTDRVALTAVAVVLTIVNYIRRYKKFSRNYHGDKLPVQLVNDTGWNSVMEALEKGSLLKDRMIEKDFKLRERYVYADAGKDRRNRYKKNLYGNEKTIILSMTYLANNLFKTGVMDGINTHNNEKDLENAILWNNQLLRQDIINRLAFLMTLNTQDERDGFLSQPKEDITEFFKPLQEFYEYVEKVHEDEEYRRNELRRYNILSSKEIRDKEDELRMNNAKEKIALRLQIAMKEQD